MKSVDLELNQITVWRTYSDAGEKGQIIEETPKTGQRRWAPPPETLKQELRSLMKDKDPETDIFTAPEGGVILEGN